MKTALGAGIVAALAVGMAMGWIRYWIGYFVLAQGAVAGLLIAWIMAGWARSRRVLLGHPGFGPALGVAGAVFTAFMAGQVVGFGLAQPWFEPVGWLGRLLEGRSSEYIFGVAATAGIHRGFAMGITGGWWIVFSLIDWAIMFFFLLAMPWAMSQSGKKDVGAGT
ncbi:MAG: hypothetical protein EOM25_12015 [Deltaproteobacteria bacterium]|nr:hypothetical protein [Deltaproteobacteria bacterium]